MLRCSIYIAIAKLRTTERARIASIREEFLGWTDRSVGIKFPAFQAIRRKGDEVLRVEQKKKFKWRSIDYTIVWHLPLHRTTSPAITSIQFRSVFMVGFGGLSHGIVAQRKKKKEEHDSESDDGNFDGNHSTIGKKRNNKKSTKRTKHWRKSFRPESTNGTETNECVKSVRFQHRLATATHGLINNTTSRTNERSDEDLTSTVMPYRTNTKE